MDATEDASLGSILFMLLPPKALRKHLAALFLKLPLGVLIAMIEIYSWSIEIQ